MESLKSYTRNLNTDLERNLREAREHGGELVARSLDGTIGCAYAQTETELERLLREKNIHPSAVVVGRVEAEGEFFIF